MGASSGIGAACALKRLALGAQVTGLDVNGARLAHEAYKNYAVDFRDEKSVSSAVAEVHSTFDRIDALVNCAGIFLGSSTFQESAECEIINLPSRPQTFSRKAERLRS
jgi:NAD(P)-dependent dehydrogenase (short-subunit alcohol dehydrogenase family)